MNSIARTFYTRLRRDRKYLPTWDKLTPKQQIAVIKESNKAYDRECGLAGDIMQGTHDDKRNWIRA